MSAETRSNNARIVQQLFNEKAAAWPEKYRPDGPLLHRLQIIGQAVEQLLAPSASVLDLGCGTGNLAFYLNRQGFEVTACDIAEQMIAEGRRAFPDAPIHWLSLAANWTRLPLESATFDAVVATSVLEYVDDLSMTLRECHRVLKPGGFLIFTAPDMRTPWRKLEKALRPLALVFSRAGVLKRLPAVDRYLLYLSVSKCRLTFDQWHRAGADAGFAVDAADAKPAACGKYMLLLQFQKQ